MTDQTTAPPEVPVDLADLEPVEPPPDHECPDDELAVFSRGDDSAASRGWGPGWPNNNGPLMTTVKAADVAVSVRKEVAPLVEWLMNQTVALGYALHQGQCWGFANRAIRGSNRPSNHSWGLAVDLNAPANPMGATLVTDMPPAMVELWTSKGFRWGGNYTGRKDAMHYEFMGTPADAQRIIAELGAGPAPAAATVPPAAAPAPSPAPSPAVPMLKKGAKGPDVKHLQERLVANGARLDIDGDFGDHTEQAVKNFQKAKGLDNDGVVGPKTWAALG